MFSTIILIGSSKNLYTTPGGGKIVRLRLNTTLTFVALWLLTTIYTGLLPTQHYTPNAINNLFFIENQAIF
jgi:hypothetical protein